LEIETETGRKGKKKDRWIAELERRHTEGKCKRKREERK